MSGLPGPFAEYFRCPDSLESSIATTGSLSSNEGYFRFGGNVCYGRRASGRPSTDFSGELADVAALAQCANGTVRVPFDFAEVVTNLRQERYQLNGYPLLHRLWSGGAARQLYYFLRPALQVGVRKHLQRIRLRGWDRIQFPRWPIDDTVDALMDRAMALLLAGGVRRIPFIWFWPDGARSCAVMTHDVEGQKGRDFCDELMDVDDSFGIKSAFQLIPQGQEAEWRTLGGRMRARGFEVNLHDLNHDGYLFDNKPQFLQRAEQINAYAREFGCDGFRSGAMYRQQEWYGAFGFSYDMSVPNVAHLEPQRGGCCTVMPYFVGNILELPLTTLQDYSLFHILGDYSIALWRRQIDAILERNGLMTFLTHPDYVAVPEALTVYRALLAHLRDVSSQANVWMTLPGEVDRWWRARRQMTLVPDGDGWRIEGPDAHRARLAYATLRDNDVRYELPRAA